MHDGQAGVCWGRSVVAHYLMVVPAYSPAGYQPPLHAANTGNYLKLEIIGIKNIELSFSCSLFWTKEVCTEENPISLTGWLFNLAYGLKWNYLLKMKFYLFINWLRNTKRIKTFLILFLKWLPLSSIGSSNQHFSAHFSFRLIDQWNGPSVSFVLFFTLNFV